ncbi:membrane protein insertion efficiency factor YidD [Rhodomicrobium sp.]|uniref:membrane protein insertion efficiency factor YidD n=1 Tax=Rhodomicrobium sp. TaxID=2720632 RepID=UPI0039E65AAD
MTVDLPALLKTVVKAPVYVYRYAISPIIGPRCRHMPTCSQYALDAIDKNGAWFGGWLTIGRILRCHPWGSSGYDPAPDLRTQGIPFWAPWRVWRYRRSQTPCNHITS